jgi:hypothetical protein
LGLSLYRVVALDPALRVSFQEASAAAVGLCGAAPAHRRVVTTQATAEAKHDGSEDEASYGGPCESHEVTADTSFEAGRSERIATLDDPCGHEGSSENLEEEGDEGHKGGEVSSEAAEESQETREESNGGEEEGNEVKGEHEARQVKVLACANEGIRDVLLSAKVPWRIKRKGGNGRAAVGIASVARVFTADGKEGPSRGVSGVRNAVCGGLEEVELVERVLVYATSQNGKELEQKTASHENQRADGKQGSSRAHGGEMVQLECCRSGEER